MEMETAAKKVPGVQFVSVNFISMKLTLEAPDEAFQRVFRQVEGVCRKVEPDVIFSENKYRLSRNEKREVFVIVLSALLFIAAKAAEGFALWEEGSIPMLLSFLPAYFLAGFHVIRKAFSGLFHGRFLDENFLMTLATFGAFAIGEAGEGVMVMVLYRIGEFFQDLAVSKSRRSVTELMDIRPDYANLLSGAEYEKVSPEQVPVGSLILVKPGEKIPLDGVITEGSSFLDTVSLTGESVPREVTVGDAVVSGCVNMNGVLTLRTEKSFGESSVSKILSLVEEAGETRSATERFITRFARIYTPAVVLLALCLALFPPLVSGNWSAWTHKAITCLVISCPCALVISIPLTFFGGIGGAGSKGILIKGADCLESLSKAKLCAFDKTGTLTKGEFKVRAVHPEIISSEELLELAATCENYSDHPISLSLKAAFNKEIDKGRIGEVREIAGEGVCGKIDGKKIYVGNEKLMATAKTQILPCEHCEHAGTVVHVAMEGTYLGHILISDTLRPDAKEAVAGLKKLGVRSIHLLSGDEADAVQKVAKDVGISEFHASLLPQDKMTVLKKIQSEKKEKETLLFVGDGINDTPVLAAADVGFAMGGIGADAAMEAADVVLIDDQPSKVALALRFAKKTMRIVWENVILSLGIKLFVLVPTIFAGEEAVPLALAVFADVGVCLLAVLNATRALHIKK